MLASTEPLLDSDEESRRIKSWLKEDEKINFDFDGEAMKTTTTTKRKEGGKPRPKSGRITADDLEERLVP